MRESERCQLGSRWPSKPCTSFFATDNENAKSEGKPSHQSEREDPETDSKRQQQPGQSHCSSDQEMKRQEEGDSSSNPESQDSDDSLEPSDVEGEEQEEANGGGGGGGGGGGNGGGRIGRLTGVGGLGGLGAIGGLGNLGGLHIKVERYGEGEDAQLHNSQTSSEEEEEEDDDNDEEEEVLQDCDSANAGNKLQKRRKRRKVQKWDGPRSKRLRLSSMSPSPNDLGDTTPLVDQSQTSSSANSSHLLTSTGSPTSASSSVLKIKTEMAEPINFDNDSSIWNFPPNREISRNESPYSMTSKPAPPSSHENFPSPQGGIPESVLTPPGNDGGSGGGVRKPPYNGNSAPSSSSSSLAPPSSASSSDPLSPPLSASPRDKQQQQGTPTTSSSSSSSSITSSSSLLYSGDLEALQRLQAGNVLPLVHRVTGTLASTSTTSPRVYTTGTIRYAPADVTLAMAQGNLLPNAAMNFGDGSGFGLDPKTPMEMLYHHVHRLNMSAAAAAGGPFIGSPTSTVGNGALGGQMPTAANVFTTAEGLFSTLPFPVYSNGIHTTQTTLERKED
ncbi:Neuronal PAS domain containing protein 3 [Dissostichus eleginoides]|uniref:Neuronal PAS domain containing protein 3 n=1 Tax=Dissostichus eleginoides TaxID=100907 RepID=A0AAD9C0P5_DISEL|nr:Neuronal PAS domain containing protein 3 [Dissostichus eleginoides]